MGPFVDRVDECSDRRVSFKPYRHMEMRGISVYCSASIPWPTRLNADAREMATGAECEIHMGNATARLCSAYFRPTDRAHRKAALLEKELSI